MTHLNVVLDMVISVICIVIWLYQLFFKEDLE